jgi:hypothetical protein
MPKCIVEQRRAVEAAASYVDADPRAKAVDVIGPAAGPRDAWVLDVVCGDPGHTPLSIQRRLTEREACIVKTAPKGPGHRQVLAVVEVR